MTDRAHQLGRLTKSLHNRLTVGRARARGLLLRVLRGSALEAGPGLSIGLGVEVDVYGDLRLGRDVTLASGCHLYVGPGAELVIGDGVFVGRHTVVAAGRSIRIGARTAIAEHCTIRDGDHDPDPARRREGGDLHTPIEIDDDCWIGAGVRILRGSRLGPGVVVGANAVVRSAFEAAVVVAGVPARVVRRLGAA
jgi:acetyltransferase-like isoleucine patch superfamily enzyme